MNQIAYTITHNSLFLRVLRFQDKPYFSEFREKHFTTHKHFTITTKYFFLNLPPSNKFFQIFRYTNEWQTVKRNKYTTKTLLSDLHSFRIEILLYNVIPDRVACIPYLDIFHTFVASNIFLAYRYVAHLNIMNINYLQYSAQNPMFSFYIQYEYHSLHHRDKSIDDKFIKMDLSVLALYIVFIRNVKYY